MHNLITPTREHHAREGCPAPRRSISPSMSMPLAGAAPWVDPSTSRHSVRDLVTLAAHEFEGREPVGALYVPSTGTHLLTQQHGGLAEAHHRARHGSPGLGPRVATRLCPRRSATRSSRPTNEAALRRTVARRGSCRRRRRTDRASARLQVSRSVVPTTQTGHRLRCRPSSRGSRRRSARPVPRRAPPRSATSSAMSGYRDEEAPRRAGILAGTGPPPRRGCDGGVVVHGMHTFPEWRRRPDRLRPARPTERLTTGHPTALGRGSPIARFRPAEHQAAEAAAARSTTSIRPPTDT